MTCSKDILTDISKSKTALVIPAFETKPNKNMTLAHALAGAAAAMNKTQLSRLLERDLVYQFAKYLYPKVKGRGGGARRFSIRF
jgi:hypothetical protein